MYVLGLGHDENAMQESGRHHDLGVKRPESKPWLHHLVS